MRGMAVLRHSPVPLGQQAEASFDVRVLKPSGD